MARKRRKNDRRKRTKSGQLSRAGISRVKPNERVQAMQEMFGNHYSSALGRAYAAGLLGEGTQAKTRLDAGNKFALRYSKIIGGDSYTSPLDRSVRGSNDNHDTERDLHQKQWLFDVMDRLDKAGARPWLDQLIHKNYTDAGPHWVDALVAQRWNKRDRRWLEGAVLGDRGDLVILDAANKALDIVAGYNLDQSDDDIDIPLHMCHGAVNA